MALINHRAREIHFKVVYYGPAQGGKTTNLQVLRDRLPSDRRGHLLSIATEHERTLFFDFMPVELGLVNGLRTRFHLYTVPGQVYYRRSRRAVIQGADAIVFVADSHPAREAANRETHEDLDEQLRSLGLDGPATRLPRIYQYNKRDCPVAVPVARMRALLHGGGSPEFEAIASRGVGVAETLRCALKLLLGRLLAGDPAGTLAPPEPPRSPAPAAPATAS